MPCQEDVKKVAQALACVGSRFFIPSRPYSNSSARSFMTGTDIGSYRILDKLGEGGMGVGYKAVDTSLDPTVAIKVLSTELARNPELVARFRNEARAQANLNHTNLATLYA